jgi:tetratricopeptide (TPR) repeat protein
MSLVMKHSRALIVSMFVVSAAVFVAAQAQHDHGNPTGQLGTVHFTTSCSKAVTSEFDRGVALLHSFWFSAAIDAFNGVLKNDPSCAMANWGIAMSWWGNPFGGFRSPQALQSGLAAVEKAKAAPPKTDRERAYIAAVEVLFKDAATVPQRQRTVGYEQAMEQLVAKYPEDIEARLFYALALDQTALPTDKTYANQLKAAGILEKEFVKQPEHPGLAHYIIHSYDAPTLAPKALDAARRYAKIAPAAPHALHMPSHTFTRVGAWQESIDTNLASAAAARKDNAASEELHAMDYQVYAYLQTAQDAAARKSVEAIQAIGARIQMNAAGAAAPPPAGFYAMAAIPARYALERNAWKVAASLTPRETAFAYADAITHFARALGAARSGSPGEAAKDVEKLGVLHAALQKANDAYWPEQIDIQRRIANAWIALAEGRRTEALTMLREAADREDATEKSAISPGPIKPARELLGEMLLELNQPGEALQQFEATMKKEPNRFRGVYGAAVAAQASGDRAKARTYFAQLLEIAKRADRPGRPELQEAQKAARGAQ